MPLGLSLLRLSLFKVGVSIWNRFSGCTGFAAVYYVRKSTAWSGTCNSCYLRLELMHPCFPHPAF